MRIDWTTAEPGLLFVGAAPERLITAVSLPHWAWSWRIVSAEPLGDGVYLQRMCYYRGGELSAAAPAYRARTAPESLAEFLLRGTEERCSQNQYTDQPELSLLTWALALPQGSTLRPQRLPLWTDSQGSSGFACLETEVWYALAQSAQDKLAPRLLGVSQALDPAPSLQAPAKFWQHLGRAKNRR